MAVSAGTPNASFGRPQQVGAMAQSAGCCQISGGFMAVSGCTDPGWKGVGSPLRVTVFTAIDEIPQRNIKAGIAARSAQCGYCMALLAKGQVGFCLGTVQSGIDERDRVCRTRSG